MQRVENNQQWSLFCPNEAPGLADCHGDKFVQLYESYENTPGKARATLDARKIWQAILESQVETGTPYMCFKDAANNKSNQQNLGTIKSSNLCTEIMEYTSPDEIAVCNLASLALPMYVVTDITTKQVTFDHQRLYEVTYQVTLNLNKIIDVNYYPVKQAEYSNKRHRPIGIGVQGLADTFILMRMPFDSVPAKQLNDEIFETIYYAAMTASKDLAIKDGPYDTYSGSPVSRGIFQFDMWNKQPTSNRWNWDELKLLVQQHGVRNSLLLAPMPTASTSQILGNNEAFEPYTSNLYVRRTLAGEFVCVSRHLLKDLIELGIWNNSLKDKLIAHKGSVRNIHEIPEHIRELYKTVWEISQKSLIDMAADRGKYICQSQSLNLHVTDLNYGKLTSMHFYAWKSGLKTGMYYLRTRPATDAIQFTIDPSTVKAANASKLQQLKKSTIDSNDISAPLVGRKSSVTTDEQARQQIEDMKLRDGITPQPSPLSSPGFNGVRNVAVSDNSAIPIDVLNDDEKSKLEKMTPEERRIYREDQEARMVCRRDNPDACVMCSG